MAVDLTETAPILDPVRLPWTRLFRSVGVALDAKKLLLAALGLILLAAGWAGLDRIFDDSSAVTPAVLGRALPWSGVEADGPMLAIAFLLADPFRILMAPFFAAFNPSLPPGAFWHAVLAAAWAVVVWGIVGGAIARIAVVQVALGERVGIRDALRFALGKAVPLVGAPLTPFLGVACFAGFCGVMGLLYRIPIDAVHAVLGFFLFLPLLAGLVMAIILLGLAVGWPLMHATVAAEGEDGFDALSRTYAYVYQRPGRYAAYTALAWALGTVGLVVVVAFARVTVNLAHWGLTIGAPDERIDGLFRTTSATSFPATTHAGWLWFVDLLAYGWIYSYFWTSATIVYLLLRHDVDGTEWHDIRPAIAFGQTTASTAVDAEPPGETSDPPVESPPVSPPA